MLYDYHIGLGGIAVLLGFLGDFLYLRSIYFGKTKAHPFTWITYALTDSIIFGAQLLSGGGAGAWVTGIGVLALVVIAVAAIRSGEKHIPLSDWVCFFGALVAIGLWKLSSDPLLAVLSLTFVNAVAVVPTLRKSYLKPFEESISIWSIDIFRFAFAIAALSTISLTTALFPGGVVFANTLLVAAILIRRRQLSRVSRI